MSSGSLIGSMASYGISGIVSCARSETGATARAASRATLIARFMVGSSRSARGAGGRLARDRLEHDLLGAPGGDLDDHELVGIAAVHRVHGAELTQLLPGLAELTDDGAVEFHLVDLAAHRVERG